MTEWMISFKVWTNLLIIMIFDDVMWTLHCYAWHDEGPNFIFPFPRSCQLLCVHCSHFKQQLTLVLFYVVVGTRREPPLCCMTIATTSNWSVPEMAIRSSPPSLRQLQPAWNRLCYNFIASFCGHHMRLAVAMSTPTLTLHQETLPDYNASTMVAMDVSIYLCQLREVVRRLGFQGVLWEKSLVRQ